VTQLAATPPPAADLLTAWEVGRHASTAQRSVLLLGALAPQLDGDALLGLSLGDRDARLLAAHRQLFGPELECVVRCPACGADLELALAVDALPASAADDAEAVVETGEWRVVVRALTLGDVLDAGAAEDLAAARRVLLARAVVSATGPEEALPAAVEAAVEAELERRNPTGALELGLRCPDCEHDWTAPLDLPAYIWAEVDGWAQRTLIEVHALATAYGWREADILALSVPRRAVYLELAGHG
jgi:hypothetical protein